MFNISIDIKRTINLLTGASSSIIEDKNKVLEKILDDLHRGNFRPVIKSEANTPDDVDPLEFSNISFIGSPFGMRKSCDALQDVFMSPPHENTNFRTSSGMFYFIMGYFAFVFNNFNVMLWIAFVANNFNVMV